MTNKTHNTNPVKTKPRRWFRFRLRTLLVMVTLLTVPLGWVGWELDQRRREKKVVAWVEEMGGIVHFHSSFEQDERRWWEKTKDNWLGKRVLVVDLLDKPVRAGLKSCLACIVVTSGYAFYDIACSA